MKLQKLSAGFKFLSAPFFISRRKEIRKKYNPASDNQAFLSDWQAVGRDLRKVLTAYGK